MCIVWFISKINLLHWICCHPILYIKKYYGANLLNKNLVYICSCLIAYIPMDQTFKQKIKNMMIKYIGWLCSSRRARSSIADQGGNVQFVPSPYSRHLHLLLHFCGIVKQENLCFRIDCFRRIYPWGYYRPSTLSKAFHYWMINLKINNLLTVMHMFTDGLMHTHLSIEYSLIYNI